MSIKVVDGGTPTPFPPAGEPAATYYVDSVSGSDTNNGTSTSSPWASVPGMFWNGSSHDSHTWNGSPNPLSAGDIVEIKAGSTFNNASVKSWYLTSTHYSAATQANPIIIRVSSTWGSGNVVYTISNCPVTDSSWGPIAIRSSNIQLLGKENREFEITGGTSGQSFGLMIYGSNGNHAGNLIIDYVNSHNHTGSSSGCLGYTDNALLKNSKFNDSGYTGFLLGMEGDIPNTLPVFEDCQFNDNLAGTGFGTNHGCQVVGQNTTVIFRRCAAANNRRDGFDFGIVNATNITMTVKLIDCDAYDNGEDGLGCNNQDTNSGTVTVQTFNSVLHNNGNGTQPYDGVQLEMYHSILTLNGRGIFTNNFTCGTPDIVNIYLRNSIIAENQPAQDIYGPNCVTNPGTTEPTFDCDGNIWIPAVNNSETGWIYPFTGAVNYNYISPPSFVTANNDIYGTANDPGFTNLVSTFASCDFHCATSGTADGAGVSRAGFPSETDFDRDGNARSASTPTIGIYENTA